MPSILRTDARKAYCSHQYIAIIQKKDDVGLVQDESTGGVKGVEKIYTEYLKPWVLTRSLRVS